MKRKSPMPVAWDGQGADPEPTPASINVYGEETAPIYLSGREMALLLEAAASAADEHCNGGTYTRARTLYHLCDRLEVMLREKFPGVKEALS